MEDNNFVPVKERFAKAKRDQQQKEAEKIEKIKGNRKPGVDTSDNTGKIPLCFIWLHTTLYSISLSHAHTKS